jgi:DNA primase
VEAVVVAFDNDSAGRDGMARAIEDVSRARRAPALRIVDPGSFGNAKDPDGFVREYGIARFRELVDGAACGVAWRALELIGDITPDDAAPRRHEALGRAGGWLGLLPARLSLEQEDAIRQVADRCGYSREAVERTFRARFWDRAERSHRRGLVVER